MDIDALEAEIARLSARPYAEIGVPMYIVPENLCDGAPEPAPAAPNALSRAFDEAVAALEAKRGPLHAEDLARIIEVLADRTFLDQPFSALSDGDQR